MDAIIKRWRSKTYRVALVGVILTVIEQNVGLISTLIPEAYRAWAVMFWPVAMLVLREMTTEPIEAK